MFWYLILPCRSSHTHYILIPMLMIVSVLQYVTLHCTGHDLWQLMAYFSTCSFRQISSILQMTVQKFTRYFKSQKSQTTPRVYIFLVETHQNSAAALLSDRDDESRYILYMAHKYCIFSQWRSETSICFITVLILLREFNWDTFNHLYEDILIKKKKTELHQIEHLNK